MPDLPNSRRLQALLAAIPCIRLSREKIAATFLSGREKIFFTWIPVPLQGGWGKARVDYRQTQSYLRKFVQAWFDSGPNVSKLFASNPDLERASRNIGAHVVATKTAQAKLLFTAASQNISPADPQFTALGLFLNFLLNPFNERLGGPCAYCEKYFVKKTRRKTAIYCSQPYAKRFTSRLANQNRRKTDYKDQLRIVGQAISDWQRARTRLPWKGWVSQKTHVSKNWITRAVKKGEIGEPKR
jgi:hypothetical protein